MTPPSRAWSKSRREALEVLYLSGPHLVTRASRNDISGRLVNSAPLNWLIQEGLARCIGGRYTITSEGRAEARLLWNLPAPRRSNTKLLRGGANQ